MAEGVPGGWGSESSLGCSLPSRCLPPSGGLLSGSRWPRPSRGREEQHEMSWKELRDEEIS